MSFRTFVPYREVKGHVVRAWRKREPELTTFSAIKTFYSMYLLDDGRVVMQEHLITNEKPSRHFLVYAPGPRQRQTIEEFLAKHSDPAQWQELPGPRHWVLVGGR